MANDKIGDQQTLYMAEGMIGACPSEERAMSNELLYVLARNYEDARDYAYKKGYHYSRMVNVDRREKLMGSHDVKLHVVPGAEDRKNYAELMQEAKIRRLEIVDVQ